MTNDQETKTTTEETTTFSFEKIQTESTSSIVFPVSPLDEFCNYGRMCSF